MQCSLHQFYAYRFSILSLEAMFAVFREIECYFILATQTRHYYYSTIGYRIDSKHVSS